MIKTAAMSKKFKVPLLVLLMLGGVSLVALFIHSASVAVLNPKGTIAHEQFRLIVTTASLSLIVVIPVYALTFYIAWKYREGNTKAKYRPNHDHSRTAEAIWWLVPLALISVLAVITWVSSHKLDPFKPIESSKKPLTIQVVALEWKWLFIYPEQNIATLNYVQFPEKTPIRFELTADAPMNSFWIPQLGGQIYAMAGMSTHLNLEANESGSFRGSSSNISGDGFAGMKFTARATSDADFNKWLGTVRRSPLMLTAAQYDELARPSKDNPPLNYASSDKGLYDKVIMKYTTPGLQGKGISGMPEDGAPMHEGMSH
jgi:cytochrome o ubiquinol oxidase subunit 2